MVPAGRLRGPAGDSTRLRAGDLPRPAGLLETFFEAPLEPKGKQVNIPALLRSPCQKGLSGPNQKNPPALPLHGGGAGGDNTVTTSGHRVEQIGRRSYADPVVRLLLSSRAASGGARVGASRGIRPSGGLGAGTPWRGPGLPTAEPWSGEPDLGLGPGPTPWDALLGNPRPCITKARAVG